MNDNDTNDTDSYIGIPTPDGTKNVHPGILKGYLDEAFNYLRGEAEAKARFKEVVETFEETTEIPKAIFSKWVKARFKEETDKTKNLATTFDALDHALPDGVY